MVNAKKNDIVSGRQMSEKCGEAKLLAGRSERVHM
jgi:hypothetical protein